MQLSPEQYARLRTLLLDKGRSREEAAMELGLPPRSRAVAAASVKIRAEARTGVMPAPLDEEEVPVVEEVMARPAVNRVSRVVIISDLHFPDHDVELIEKFLAWLENQRVDRLVILGDMLDAMSISRWTVEDEVSLEEEIAQVAAFLDRLAAAARHLNPQCEIDYVEGNHEDRLTKYLIRNAGKLANLELDGVPVVSLPHLLSLRQRRIKHYRYRQVIKLSKELYLEHGDRVAKNSAATAMGVVRDKGGSVILGHVHRVGAYYKKDRMGFHRGYELGCMCSLNPRYLTEESANWQQGWGVVEFYGPELWWYTPVVVQNGMFMWSGRVY